MKSRTRTIKVDYLARVEGEGALDLKIAGGEVRDVKLRIFEPPRFFEAFLRGRAFAEAPDVTARICGICPVAYQMSSVHALERALGVRAEGPLRELRRLLYCGEWIESHVLHVHLLHAPDFLGYPDGVAMAKDHPEAVRRALAMKKLGNEILEVLGGRAVHPVNVRVGGFYRLPEKRELDALAEKLRRGRDMAREAVRWAASLPYPDLERDYDFVALRHPDEYPMNEGRIVSSSGLELDASEFEAVFRETHVEHSNALHCEIAGRGAYVVGPLARYAHNAARLSPLAKEAAREAGLGEVCRNPYKALLVRAVEVLYAFDEAVRVLSAYEPPEAPCIPLEVRAGEGAAATEAPRGLLYQRYRIAENGDIVEARIVPPTSQNQKSIEADLAAFAAGWLDLPDEALRDRCEQAIRNYDPCISCATHFLKLRVEREA